MGRAKEEMAMIDHAVNRTQWTATPADVNAYYSRNRNQIMFPAGILQPPFYHKYFPKALNYGGIGVVIGHEITHGFDDKGRHFDHRGNINQWWDTDSSDNFHQRAQCIINQYSNYKVDQVGIYLNGLNTQGENIADNGGIKQAFHAYKNVMMSSVAAPATAHDSASPQGPEDSCEGPDCLVAAAPPPQAALAAPPATVDSIEPVLPGLQHLKNDQLFFLNFAQVWCGSFRHEALRFKLKTAVHAPGKYRVIGTLSNSKEFAKAFNCPNRMPMNPEQVLSVVIIMAI